MNYTSNKTPKKGSLKDSEDIARQTLEFLKKGGGIQQIKSGVTGIVEKPRKGMKIDIKSKRT